MPTNNWRTWPFEEGYTFGRRIEPVSLEEARSLPKLGRDYNNLHQSAAMVRRLVRFFLLGFKPDEERVIVSLGHIVSLISGIFTDEFGDGIQIDEISRLRSHSPLLTDEATSIFVKVLAIDPKHHATFSIRLKTQTGGKGEGRLIVEAEAIARRIPLFGVVERGKESTIT